ncbi:hypothetical protein FQN57_007211 [Myotisia sp. PD_48]|nr:hypothetical protein FQN57_007211 [Myotisia sp. PD_48]
MAPKPLYVFSSIILVVLHTFLLIAPATSLEIAYCSSMNTGSNFNSVIDNFQSNGACHQTCSGKYAFAILQGKKCWCSNNAPGNTVSTDKCDDSCPGYPSDKCGNTSDGLYGYIELDKKPSSTIGGASSTSSSVSHTQSSQPLSTVSTRPTITGRGTFITSSTSIAGSSSLVTLPPTLTSLDAASSTQLLSSQKILTQSIQTSTSHPEASVTITVTESHTSSLPTSSSVSTKTTPPNSSNTDSGTATLTTVGGNIVTITVPNHGPTDTSSSSNGDGGSALSGGAIAGIIIGSLAGFGVIAAVILWFFFRRRQKNDDDGYRDPFHESPVPRPIFESTLSSRVPAMTTNPTTTHSGSGRRSGGPREATARLSIPAFTDHRMKKDAMVYSNGGRHSNVSLQDNQDYSRPVLRLTNPDPPEH